MARPFISVMPCFACTGDVESLVLGRPAGYRMQTLRTTFIRGSIFVLAGWGGCGGASGANLDLFFQITHYMGPSASDDRWFAQAPQIGGIVTGDPTTWSYTGPNPQFTSSRSPAGGINIGSASFATYGSLAWSFVSGISTLTITTDLGTTTYAGTVDFRDLDAMFPYAKIIAPASSWVLSATPTFTWEDSRNTASAHGAVNNAYTAVASDRVAFYSENVAGQSQWAPPSALRPAEYTFSYLANRNDDISVPITFSRTSGPDQAISLTASVSSGLIWSRSFTVPPGPASSAGPSQLQFSTNVAAPAARRLSQTFKVPETRTLDAVTLKTSLSDFNAAPASIAVLLTATTADGAPDLTRTLGTTSLTALAFKAVDQDWVSASFSAQGIVLRKDVLYALVLSGTGTGSFDTTPGFGIQGSGDVYSGGKLYESLSGGAWTFWQGQSGADLTFRTWTSAVVPEPTIAGVDVLVLVALAATRPHRKPIVA
jgi:hypothetical protein